MFDGQETKNESLCTSYLVWMEKQFYLAHCVFKKFFEFVSTFTIECLA